MLLECPSISLSHYLISAVQKVLETLNVLKIFPIALKTDSEIWDKDHGHTGRLKYRPTEIQAN